jgi:hypothetical protein
VLRTGLREFVVWSGKLGEKLQAESISAEVESESFTVDVDVDVDGRARQK